ncbi:unnamed protein product [Bathycoccus prasinos]
MDSGKYLKVSLNACFSRQLEGKDLEEEEEEEEEEEKLEACYAQYGCDINIVTDHYAKVAGVEKKSQDEK